MKIALLLICLGSLGCHALDCPKNGWSQAEDICYRIVHFPESYWSAYHHCQSFGGNLLQLKNVKQVKDAIGDSMQGNAGEFRIDGYANGTWYQRKTEVLEHADYEFLSSLTGKTLTLNVQDGRVSGDTEQETRIGFICEGGDGLVDSCSKDDENDQQKNEENPTKECKLDYTIDPNAEVDAAFLKALQASNVATIRQKLKDERVNATKSIVYATMFSTKEVIQMLIDEYCASVNHMVTGLTPLMVTVQRRDTETMRLIINSGAKNVDQRSTGYNSGENTALHVAAERCKYEMVKILVEEANATKTITNKDNKTAKDLADARSSTNADCAKISNYLGSESG